MTQVDEKALIRPRVRPFPLRPIHIHGLVGIVTLTQGRVAIIDATDAVKAGERNWAFRLKQGQPIAHTNVRLASGRYIPVPLHRYLMDAEPGTLIDHINGDTLDNRRENLRLADRSGNSFNSRRRKDNTSGFKGVRFDKRRQKWFARIKAGEVRRHMGPFPTAEDAHAAYCAAAQELHGEFARMS